MNSLDLIASLVIGSYLIGAVVRGNTGPLLELAKRDKAFLKWAIAVAALYYLYGIPELQGAASLLIFAAFLGMVLVNFTNIKSGMSTFWNSLGN